jgi:hypothetical protein
MITLHYMLLTSVGPSAHRASCFEILIFLFLCFVSRHNVIYSASSIVHKLSKLVQPHRVHASLQAQVCAVRSQDVSDKDDLCRCSQMCAPLFVAAMMGMH